MTQVHQQESIQDSYGSSYYNSRGHHLKFFVSIVLLSVISISLAQTYTWHDVVQTIDIQANGDVLVTDERTLMATGGDFGEAFVEVMLEPGQTLTMLTEESGALTAWEGARAYQNNIDGGQEVVVGNPNRATQTRIREARVRYVYRLENTLDVYSDVVQWYWQVIGLEDVAVRGYTLQVTAPGPMSTPYDAFVHRYDNLEEPEVVLSSDRSQLTVEFADIPASEGLEIRYLMDPELFEVSSIEPGLEDLLQDEARIAGLVEDINQEPNQSFETQPSEEPPPVRETPSVRDIPSVDVGRNQRRLSPFTVLVTIIATAFTVLAASFIILYRRVGREPRVASPRYRFEPPSELPPAALPALFQQRFQGNAKAMLPAFHATVMDLARRGYGEFQPEKGFLGKHRFGMVLHLDQDDSELLELERAVLNYLKKAAAHKRDGEMLTFSELKSYSQNHFASFMHTWAWQVRRYVEAQLGGSLITPASQRATSIWFFIMTAIIAASISLIGFAITQLAGVAQAGSSLVIIILSLVFIILAEKLLPAWRPEVAREIQGWRAFKRGLRDFSQMKHAPDDFFQLWDKYYCYAAALGVAKKFLKNIGRATPLKDIDEVSLGHRAHWMGGSSFSSDDFASFSKSINSLSSALNSSSSASSGESSSGGSRSRSSRSRSSGGGGGR